MTDPLILARIQFAANISFHILFPTISLGLAWVLLWFKLRHNATVKAARASGTQSAGSHWMDAYQFWVKIFALTFALGVVSGITMSFQFGTNWPGFMKTVGNIAGPLLAYEVMTAFFLEASFLGIMLFGAARVGERMHTVATILVAGGTTLSAFWILALNSWMHTPAGFEMRNGQAHATDWLAIIFNPSFPYRFTHMALAAGLTVSFLVAGISAYRWLRGDRVPAVLVALRTGVYLAAILIPLQIMAGDAHGLNTLEYEPAKLAAMEGLWKDESGVPALLFAIPDQQARTNHFEIGVPKLASIYLTHSLNGTVRGLDSFPDRNPPVAPLFFAFRLMVGVGLLMLAVSWSAAWLMRGGRAPTALIARVLTVMTFSGWVAVLAGWCTTEVGRQPFLVYGILTTAQAASDVPAAMIAATLALYLTLYAALITAYISVVFYLARKAGHGNTEPAAEVSLPLPA